MLSPGKWHLQVPTGFVANLKFRLKLLRLCRGRPSRQRAIIEACRQDFFFWVNTFAFQYNPNAIGEGSPEMGPFILWDFQIEAARKILWCIQHRRDVVVEKSREMGASWLILLVLTWLLLFHPNKKSFCLSRNEEAVDKVDDSDSLFWKIDFVLSYLPDWLTGGGVRRRKRSFRHRLNGSSMTGQATTKKAGVSGRYYVLFMDETAQIDEAGEILARTRDTTACRIFVSTHLGIGTTFHDLTIRPDIHKAIIHWSQHPDKKKGLYRYHADTNSVEVLDKGFAYPDGFTFVHSPEPVGGPYPGLRSPWYDLQCSRPGAHKSQIAKDLDINPGGSVSQFYDALMIRALIHQFCFEPLWEGDVEFDPETGRFLSLVKVKGGPLKCWVHPIDGERFPSGKYGMGCDLSEGIGHTPSIISAASAKTGDKILEYATAGTRPEKLAVLAMALGWALKDDFGDPALIGWEDMGPGRVFGKKLVEYGYPRIFTRESATLRSKKRTTIPGWPPNQVSRLDLHSQYRAALHNRHFINHNEFALKECLPYYYGSTGNTIEHPKHRPTSDADDASGAGACHGDRATADALTWKMLQQFGKVGRVAQEEEEKVQTCTLAWRRLLAEGELTRSKW